MAAWQETWLQKQSFLILKRRVTHKMKPDTWLLSLGVHLSGEPATTALSLWILWAWTPSTSCSLLCTPGHHPELANTFCIVHCVPYSLLELHCCAEDKTLSPWLDCSSPLFLQQFRMPRKVASADIRGFHRDVLIVTKLALRRSPYLPVPEASFSSLHMQASSATSQELFEDIQLGSGGCSHRCWLWYPGNMLAGEVWSLFVWIQIWHHVVGYQFRRKFGPLVGCPIDFHRLSICLIDFFFFLLQTESCSSALWRLLHFFFFFCTCLALYYIGLFLLSVNANQLFLRRISMTFEKTFNLTGPCFPHLLNGGGDFCLDCLEAWSGYWEKIWCLVVG